MGDVKVFMALGSLIIAIVGLIGGVLARDRNISKRISDGAAKTHERIDELKDDINANFARKGDVQESVRRVERGIESLGQELRQNHKDLTALLIKGRD